MARKYKNEIHANEIVLLAYYIAAINIEAVYHDLITKIRALFPQEGRFYFRCTAAKTAKPLLRGAASVPFGIGPVLIGREAAYRSRRRRLAIRLIMAIPEPISA